MRVGSLRRLQFVALTLAVLVISGCGQKGSLYRDDGVPGAEAAPAADQADQTGTLTDDKAPPQR